MKGRVEEILERYENMDSGKLMKIKATEYSIDLKQGRVKIRQRPYKTGPKSREVLEEHIKNQLEAEIIEPEQNNGLSPYYWRKIKMVRWGYALIWGKLTHQKFWTHTCYHAWNFESTESEKRKCSKGWKSYGVTGRSLLTKSTVIRIPSQVTWGRMSTPACPSDLETLQKPST